MTVADGIYFPVLTPFNKDGTVDHETFAELLEFGIDEGMHGIFALGSAGQGPTLDRAEYKHAIDTVVETVDEQVPLVVHVGTTSTMTTVELARYAEQQGVDMLAFLPPYYYSDHSWAEIVGHFRCVADATETPMMIYNNPKYAGISISPEELGTLVEEIPQIQGIKASFNPLKELVEYADRTPDGFKVFAGAIWSLLSGTHYGVSGAINPPAGVVPEIATTYWDLIQDKDYEGALAAQERLFAFNKAIAPFRERYGRAAYKPLFALRGIEIKTYPRWDTVDIEPGTTEELITALNEAGVSEYFD